MTFVRFNRRKQGLYLRHIIVLDKLKIQIWENDKFIFGLIKKASSSRRENLQKSLPNYLDRGLSYVFLCVHMNKVDISGVAKLVADIMVMGLRNRTLKKF